MFAIIRTGGHQEKVTVGEQITVDLLHQEVGAEVRFVPLMVSRDDGTIVSDHKELQESASVVGRVLKHVKGDKVDVFQYRQKTGYRRHTGHRQPMTLVEITEIKLGDIVGTPPPKVEEPVEQPAAEAAEAPPAKKPKAKAAAKKAPARKAAAKTATAKKSAPRKKK